ncbi:hypothetical protein LTR53_012366 [Teratosphaeriaceae sp. CCFEE 6253]|nr:hypothetical protein LTR53_012366 [Teratosphaeriaceae sp. CCFEE 6253]
MHTPTFASCALLAIPVLANPIAHRPWVPHLPTPAALVTSLPSITTSDVSETTDETSTVTTAVPATLTSYPTTGTASSTATLTYTIGTGTSIRVLTITVTHVVTDLVTVTNTVGFPSATPANATISSTFNSSSILNTNTTTTVLSSSSSISNTSALSTSLTSSRFTPSSFLTSTSSTSSSSGASSATSVSTSSSSACTGTSTPPAPTQAGVIAGCTEWYVAVAGDYCSSVASRFGLDVDTFMAWNPAVDPPACSNMLAGDAYCVASCGGVSSTTSTSASIASRQAISSSTSGTVTTTASSTSAATSSSTSAATSSTSVAASSTSVAASSTSVAASSTSVAASSTSAAASSTSTSSDVYRLYTGDGSIADGWPAQSQWVDFDAMFDANTDNMKLSCAAWAVPDDTDAEIADMKAAITDIAAATAVDARVILAIIMQESTGCVRVITTQYSVFNPGLMQSHNGTGTCNTNNAAGASGGVVQTPCPESEIRQMIQDGAGGTASGDGLQECLAKQGNTDVSMWYRAARMYNGGSIDPSGDLAKGCCTACYASDVANRLTGWVNAPHGCALTL